MASSKQFKPADTANTLVARGLRVAIGGGELYKYDRALGVYRPGREDIRRQLTSVLKSGWEPQRANAVMKYLYDVAPPLWDRLPLDKVNLPNGILNINTMNLESHVADHRTSVQLGAKWAPKAKCPMIQKFVRQVFPPDAVPLAYEIAGLLCVPDISLQTAILLVGEGANGKSVYLHLLACLLGRDNVSHASLHDLTINRFALAELYGKLANICADIPARRLGDVGIFKAITGGDSIMSERKYGHPFHYIPYSRLVFSANNVPVSPDTSEAYLRRWLIVPFPNRFEEEKADRRLVDKLTTEKELSGFLRLSIEAYRSVRKRGLLSTGESTDKAYSEFKRASNPVVSFLEECTRIDPEAEIDRAVLFKAYSSWSRDIGHPAVTPQEFNKCVKQHVSGASLKTVRGRPIWQGVALPPVDFSTIVGTAE